MKKNLLMGALCLYGISYSQTGTTTNYSNRVGINTIEPEEKLHIKGSMKTKGMELSIPFTYLGAAETYSFLIKSPAPENKVTSYNQTFFPTSPAPLNLIQYKIKCDTRDNDWVKEFDTLINSDKFMVIISSYGYNQSTYNGDANITPVPQIYAYKKEENGKKTWALKADYEGFEPSTNSLQGEWTLNLIVFDVAYTKNYALTATVNSSGTGSASQSLIN